MTGYVLGRGDAAAGALRAAAIPVAGSADSEDLMDLHDRIDRLLLVVVAMASQLEENGVVSEQQINERVRQLDEADGTVDGKRTPSASRCGKCGAAVAPGLSACQFCGTPVVGEATPSPLDQV